MRSGDAKVCSQCGEIKLQKDFVFRRGDSIRLGRICLGCKSGAPLRKLVSVSSDGQTVWTGSGLSKSDINKLLSFSEDPEKYATGTGRAKAKIEYLDYLAGLKHQFSEEQLSTYTKAREKYDAATATREVESNAPKVDYSNTLAEAFNNQRSVKIQYKGSWRTIDPYSINGTYVVAFCHFAHDIRTFRIDRIQGAELSGGFTPDRSLLGSAKSKLMEAPSYKYRHRY